MTTAIRVYDELDSTQTEAARALAAGKSGPCWVQALRQTQGIGRRGKKWESIKGNLMASWYARLSIDHSRVGELAFVAALSVTDLLKPWVRDAQKLTIKWPNDVLYDGHKLCGILVESQTVSAPDKLGIVIGIGININGAPKLSGYLTTSVKAAMKAARATKDRDNVLIGLDPVEWLKPLSLTFEHRLSQWLEAGFVPIAEDWLARAYGIGKRVEFGDGKVAVIEGLGPSGALLVRDDSGVVHALTQGEIVYQERAHAPEH